MTTSRSGLYQTEVKPCTSAPCSHASATTSPGHPARSVASQPIRCTSAHRNSNAAGTGARASGRPGSRRAGVATPEPPCTPLASSSDDPTDGLPAAGISIDRFPGVRTAAPTHPGTGLRRALKTASTRNRRRHADPQRQTATGPQYPHPRPRAAGRRSQPGNGHTRRDGGRRPLLGPSHGRQAAPNGHRPPQNPFPGNPHSPRPLGGVPRELTTHEGSVSALPDRRIPPIRPRPNRGSYSTRRPTVAPPTIDSERSWPTPRGPCRLRTHHKRRLASTPAQPGRPAWGRRARRPRGTFARRAPASRQRRSESARWCSAVRS